MCSACCFPLSGDRAVERALREECCSVVVKLFANIAVLIYSAQVHGFGAREINQVSARGNGI